MTTPGTAAKPSRPPGRDTPRSIPRATYRIQLHRGFGFRDARRALPYLSELGVSHVYCSPYLMATPGSTHGYDVIDPTRLNPDLGTLSDYRDFCRALARHGLRQILDIVPNHMGVDTDANPWWQDVLRNGQASAHAGWFDIDWTRGRLLLPILGAPLAETIANGELALALDDSGDAFRLRYYERSLPVNDAGAALIIARASRPDDDGSLTEALADHQLIQAVVDLQYYEPAHWREASTRINYRRFFDIAGLAALRIEDPAVFEATHRTVIEWVRSGLVDGLRIDHPDGLRDPGAYFDRLQDAVRDDAGRRVYLVAEKILAPEEELPVDWPVDGTTGYDFANLLCGVLLDETTLPAIDAIWRAFTGEQTQSFGDLGRAAKREVLDASFVGDRAALARLFQAVDGSAPLAAIETVLTELVAAFPVYRAYPGSRHREGDSRAIAMARDTALARLEPNLQPTLAAMTDRLLAGLTGDAVQDEFVIRFQQLAAPVMAKGVEDTALYRWSRLVSVNDVGSDPDVHGVDVATFHAANRRRAEVGPCDACNLDARQQARRVCADADQRDQRGRGALAIAGRRLARCCRPRDERRFDDAAPESRRSLPAVPDAGRLGTGRPGDNCRRPGAGRIRPPRRSPTMPSGSRPTWSRPVAKPSAGLVDRARRRLRAGGGAGDRPDLQFGTVDAATARRHPSVRLVGGLNSLSPRCSS